MLHSVIAFRLYWILLRVDTAQFSVSTLLPGMCRVGHGSGPSTGRVGLGWVKSGLGSGRVHLCGSVWITLDYTKCYAKYNCKI